MVPQMRVEVHRPAQRVDKCFKASATRRLKENTVSTPLPTSHVDDGELVCFAGKHLMKKQDKSIRIRNDTNTNMKGEISL